MEELKSQVVSILSNATEKSVSETLTQLCTLLQENITYYDWVGFYFANHDTKTLHLKAFAGEETDHTEIPFGKGICGQVAELNDSFLVPDVTAQDNYIACSISVKAEIVVPLFKDNINIGQIDIDSNTANAFSEKDNDFLKWVNSKVAPLLSTTFPYV